MNLGDIMIKLNFAVGTSEQNLMTREKRIAAINRAIQIILEQYPIPQYVKPSTLTFTSGVASLPTDCLMPLKLQDPTNANVEYSRVTWDQFTFNINYTYTILWDSGSSTEKIYIYDTNATSLKFWYIQTQTELSSDSDTVRFNSWWEDAIAEKAAEQLLMDAASFNRAEAKQTISNNLIGKAWEIERSRITGVQDQRVKSIFNRYSLLSNNNSSFTL